MKTTALNFFNGVALAVVCLLALPGVIRAAFTVAETPPSALGKIMPLGDSITRGNDIYGGYRAPLYALLTNWLDTCTFVGSQTDNSTQTLIDASQTHHEGHGGYVIAAGSSGRSGLDENLVTWIGPSGAAPDRILLMIGSNDIGLGYDMSNAQTRLSTLIDHIYGFRSNVTLYVASIIPMVGHEPDVVTYNATLPGIVASHRALGRNVIYVPMHDALNISTDLADGLHPNAVGYQKMAQVWNEALNTITTGFVTTTTLNSSVNPSVYGQQVIFTATVKTNGVMATGSTGNVVFSVDGVARAFVAVTGGSAAYTNRTLATGARTLRAVYVGDGAYAASSANYAQTNNPGAASKLGFGQQPTATRPGTAISPAVTVLVQDADGNTETSDNSTDVTISGTTFTNSTLTVKASGGVATFSNLKPTTLGDGTTLTASAASLAGATSSSFHVGVVVISGSFIPPKNTTTTLGAWDAYMISESQSFIVGNWDTGSAILNQTGGTITFTGAWVGRMGIGSSDGPTWGEYNMSGNATFSATGLNGASSAYTYTITGYLGKSKLTLTDTATANIGSLTLKPYGGAAARVVLSGSASLTVGSIGNNTDGYVIGAGCYIDFVSGSLATLTITGTHNFTNLVNAGSIRVDGAVANMSQFRVSGNTLSNFIAPSASGMVLTIQ